MLCVEVWCVVCRGVVCCMLRRCVLYVEVLCVVC